MSDLAYAYVIIGEALRCFTHYIYAVILAVAEGTCRITNRHFCSERFIEQRSDGNIVSVLPISV